MPSTTEGHSRVY